MTYVVGVAFFAVFFGLIAFAIVSSGRQRKMWRERPGVLRALAGRRGYQFLENPGPPSALAPIRPTEKKANVEHVELPAAVKGRSDDGTFTLFDVYEETRLRHPRTNALTQQQITYTTLVTIKSASFRWPHFEYAVVAHADANSISGKLLAMASTVQSALMESRGLKSVPLPEQPGSQLYAADPNSPQVQALRDALPSIFADKSGWWLGGLDDALTIETRGDARTSTMRAFVPAAQLDRFIDDALKIEQALRRRLS